MEGWSFLELLDSVNDVADGPATNTELRLLREVTKTLLKVIRLERQVTVEFDNELPIGCPQAAVTFVEGFNHAASGLSKTSVLAMHGSDP